MLQRFVSRPVFTWVVMLAMVTAGVAAFRGLPVERLPNVDVPVVTITTLAPGFGPTQVEAEVTTKVEAALGTVGGLERLDSSSQPGVSLVMAQFVLERSGAEAAQDIRDKLSRLSGALPPGVRAPQVELFNTNAAPVLLLSVRGARSHAEVSAFTEAVVRRELESLRGVGEVRVFGAAKRALRVELDEERLLASAVTAPEVVAALEAATQDVAGAELRWGSTSTPARVLTRVGTRAELEAVVVSAPGAPVVRLGSVATLLEGPEPQASIALHDGEPAVVVSVVKQAGANTLVVLRSIRERLDALRARLPDGVTLEVVRDEGVFVEASLEAVEEHLVLGALFAALVVLVFLRNGRATLIAALAIPTSVIGTFAAVKALGLSLNMLSLLGLTLAVGIVIDDAVVVLENIVRVMESRKTSAAEAALEATREIALAVLATTLSLVAVFLPIGFMSGLVGRFLASFGLTMSVSILLSMVVAFTLTPMLCARWLKPSGHPPTPQPTPGSDPSATWSAWSSGARIPPGTAYLERAYARALGFVMARRWLVGLAMAVTMLLVVPLLARVPVQFMPFEDDARFEVFLRLPPGVQVEATSLSAERVARRLREVGVTTTVVMAGSAGDDASRAPNEATVFVALKARGVLLEVMQQARTLAAEVVPEGTLVMVNAVSDFSSAGPDGAGVQFVIRGPDLDVLGALAQSTLERARTMSGTSDHGTTASPSRAGLALSVDARLASERGLSAQVVSDVVRLSGHRFVDVGGLEDPTDSLEKSARVLVGLRSIDGAPEERLRVLTVRASSGEVIPLHEVLRPATEASAGTIRRVDRQRQVTVFLNTGPAVSDRDVVEALRTGMTLPPGYTADVIGNAKELEKTSEAFLTAIILSLVFMYLVLAAQFESWLHPLTILVSLPLVVPFAIFTLWVCGQSLNLFSALGFLVLFGIVKKNGILQVDHMLALETKGVPRVDAVIFGNLHRLRPILMTTLAFVAGLLPLVVASGPGAGTNRAIGLGVIGGQTLALGLTLLATPVVHVWLLEVREWWERRRHRAPWPRGSTPSDSASAPVRPES
jgi:hydrophobic/amphiphilic exporter-1 (mainly G- bacteria), HAE1 family